MTALQEHEVAQARLAEAVRELKQQARTIRVLVTMYDEVCEALDDAQSFALARLGDEPQDAETRERLAMWAKAGTGSLFDEHLMLARATLRLREPGGNPLARAGRNKP